MKIVKQGSVVEVEYEGRKEDEKLFDTTNEELAKKENVYIENREYKPMKIKIGEGMLIKGFENALIGMHEGEEKTVTISPEEGYGNNRPELIKSFQKDPERDKELKKGMVVLANVGDRQLPALVTEVGDNISLDFNHPLAGKNLIFKIKIVKIED